MNSGGQFCLCPETGESRAQSCKCQMLVREKPLSFLSLLCAWEAGELRDCRQNRAVLSNVTTVMARNQAASWQVSPCYSISSAAYKRSIFFLLYFFFYQGKTSSIHVPNELLVPSNRLLTQLSINSICDAHK